MEIYKLDVASTPDTLPLYEYTASEYYTDMPSLDDVIRFLQKHIEYAAIEIGTHSYSEFREVKWMRVNSNKTVYSLTWQKVAIIDNTPMFFETYHGDVIGIHDHEAIRISVGLIPSEVYTKERARLFNWLSKYGIDTPERKDNETNSN